MTNLIDSLKEWLSVLPIRSYLIVLLVELPVSLIIFAGIVWALLRCAVPWKRAPLAERETWRSLPKVSCVITCYSEGRDVELTINSLLQQNYEGVIEIITVVDGSVANKVILEAAVGSEKRARSLKNRHLIVLAKTIRGGRVSTLNSGLRVASGDVVLALDGDTSLCRRWLAPQWSLWQIPEFSPLPVICV